MGSPVAHEGAAGMPVGMPDMRPPAHGSLRGGADLVDGAPEEAGSAPSLENRIAGKLARGKAVAPGGSFR